MKVRQAYERAIALINERDSGGTYHADTADYEANACELVNSLVTLLWLDQSIIDNVSVRDFSWSFEPVGSMEDEIPLHESLASGVLPFGLAALLLLEEDGDRANYFHNIYQKAENSVMKAFSSAEHSSIKDVY